MTMLFDILAGLCLLGAVIASILEVRALLGLAGRASRGPERKRPNPWLSRLIAYSSLAAILIIGFFVLGSFGDVFNLVGGLGLGGEG